MMIASKLVVAAQKYVADLVVFGCGVAQLRAADEKSGMPFPVVDTFVAEKVMQSIAQDRTAGSKSGRGEAGAWSRKSEALGEKLLRIPIRVLKKRKRRSGQLIRSAFRDGVEHPAGRRTEFRVVWDGQHLKVLNRFRSEE